MTEWVVNAWRGWQSFRGNGKLAALLLLTLLLFWLRGNGKRQEQLLVYTCVMAGICILPVTAALLMLYQTRFYDYEWIWTAVPVVLVTAYGCVVHLTEISKSYFQKDYKRVLFVAAALAVILLCGRLGNPRWEVENVSGERQEAAQVLQALEASADQKICLWAPRAVMEYAREQRADITLFYGRNMWDKALNAYSYDVYSPQQEECCRWMTWVEETGKMRMGEKNGIEYIRTAVSMGVNRILLPADVKEDRLGKIEKKLGVEADRIGNYYLFSLDG